jgi:DNA-binding CsgD family transcriptional regulator
MDETRPARRVSEWLPGAAPRRTGALVDAAEQVSIPSDPDEILAKQHQLKATRSLRDVLAQASNMVRTESAYGRAVFLTVEQGVLSAETLGALDDPASDRLRRAILAEPVQLRPNTVESEFIRAIEAGGTGEIVSRPSVLRARYGLGEFTLGAVIPDYQVLALLVLEADGHPLGPDDRQRAQRIALQVTLVLERSILARRVDALSSELRYMIASSNALVDECIDAPMTLDFEQDKQPVFGQFGRMAARDADELRELFTRREWTVAREIVAGKSNREIAASLQLTPGTVKVYVSRVLRKLGATNRAEAVARCYSLIANAR